MQLTRDREEEKERESCINHVTVCAGFRTISRVQVLLSYLATKLSFSDAATFTFARNVYAEHRRNFLEVQVYR